MEAKHGHLGKQFGHLGKQFDNKRYSINGKIPRRSFTIYDKLNTVAYYEVHDNNLNKTAKDWNILLNSHCMINNTIINAVNSLLHINNIDILMDFLHQNKDIIKSICNSK